MQGQRAGRRDRDAYRIGSEVGFEQARLSASEDAYARITAQFHDLTREPRADARPADATRRAMEHEIPMPVVRKPRLLDVFEDLPLASSLVPRPDPFKLYRCNNYDDFFDRRWAEPARFVRSAYRGWHDPGVRYPNFGFRCLRSGVGQAAPKAR